MPELQIHTYVYNMYTYYVYVQFFIQYESVNEAAVATP